MTPKNDAAALRYALTRLSRNLWWCWDPDAPAMWRDLSPELWAATRHNPVAMLADLEQVRFEAACADPTWSERAAEVCRRFDAYLAEGCADIGDLSVQRPVAYFCAEYGLHESLRLYSGGLGVLAGDHLKSASDLRIPLIAVGLFYRGGYLRQGIGEGGEQVALALENVPEQLPIEPVVDQDGRPVEVAIDLAGRSVRLKAWRIAVGRTTLLVIDADVEGNTDEDRDITNALYSGDTEMRIRQELVLGCGGARMLQQLGITPAVWHMNEGHAAFLALERMRALMASGASRDDAHDQVRATTLFTTHTPVPAGHDRFGLDLTRRYLGGIARDLGYGWEEFLEFGRGDIERDVFNMTLLAFGFASYTNGVSKLHGVASRQLLAGYWTEMTPAEIDIDAVTNGVHLSTWTHPRLRKALGAADRPLRGRDFETVTPTIPAADLWAIRSQLRAELLAALCEQVKTTESDPGRRAAMLAGLEGAPLLIGFARRFAGYKRADLLVSDPEHLARVLGDPRRPMRLLIAGKAHPRDERGKEILAAVVKASRSEPLLGKVFFLRNYGMALARHLVQGVDVWLNTPRRMQEASGTSGMKSAANGGLNLSISDGWWPEAADGTNGWTIGGQAQDPDNAVQDAADGAELFRLLEQEVGPRFYDRDQGGVPIAWMRMVARSLVTSPPVFNTDRMVGDYVERAYRPLGRRADART